MKHIGMLLIGVLNFAFLAHAADLFSASSQDLLALYKQLREIQRGDKSGNLLFHISWNRDSLLLPAFNKDEEVFLLHLIPGQYFEVWCGFHLASEYAQSPHPDHRILHIHSPAAKIDMQVDNDQKLSAAAQLEYEVRAGPVRVLPFNLNGVLRIGSIEDGAGRKLGFIQEDRRFDSDPWLILDEPAKPGQQYKISVSYREDSTYETRIIYDRGGGLYFVASRDSWYPSFGTFDDRTQYEINARSPKRFVFLASGIQTAATKERDELVTSWKSEIPVSSIGFNYGDFVEAVENAPGMKLTAYAGRTLPDELRAMETGFATMSIMGTGRTDRELMRGGLNTTATIKHAAGMSIQAFRLFEFLFGALPFKSLSVVQQPTSGGSSGWPNLVFLPYTAFLDATMQNKLGMQQSGEQREFYKTVAIREMARQWWRTL